MASFEFTSPEGKKYTVEGPPGATQDQAFQILQKQMGSPAPTTISMSGMAEPQSITATIGQGIGNATSGALRGAGSIGATLLAPYDMAKDALDGKGLSLDSNRQRRTDMDSALQTMGAQPDSLLYQAGKLGGEIAGTAGVGTGLAVPLKALGATKFGAGLEPLIEGGVQALKTGGFRVGPLAGTEAGAIARIAGGAATGGASAALVDPTTAGTGAMIGGALPAVVQGAGKVGVALRNAIAPKAEAEVAKLAQRAQELGIDIPADRIVNSKPMNAIAASLNYVPFSGRQATEEKMTAQLDRALSRTFGQDSPNVTQALRKADDVLGAKFEQTLSQNGVKFDQPLLDGLASVYNKAEAELGPDALKPIKANIDELIRKGESGLIDGQAAYNIKKDLDRIGRGSGNEAHHALELKSVLLDALNRSLGPDKAKEFATVRQQYGNMLELSKLAQNGVEGGVSVARLANMKNINNPEMQELADIAATFVKPREGQHGAAQRAVIGGVAGYVGGIPGLLAGAAAGRATNSALNSNSLRNLVLNQGTKVTPDDINLLTRLSTQAAPLLPAQ